MTNKTLFISYSHDNDAHRERVLGLSQRLRSDGFFTQLDRYVPGTPEEGWPRWMLNRLDEAAFVLVICTETYYRRFRGHGQTQDGHPRHERTRGKGTDWEGAIITQDLYDHGSRATRFVPVLFDASHARFIPEPLRPRSRYLLDSDTGYGKLLDFLDGVAGVEPGPVAERPPGKRRRTSPLVLDNTQSPPSPRSPQSPSSTFDPHIASTRLPSSTGELFGRQKELARLDRALRDPAIHVIQLIAWGGVGKTALVVHWMARLAARDWCWQAPDGPPDDSPGHPPDHSRTPRTNNHPSPSPTKQNDVPRRARRYFDWSFYSQGARDRGSPSADAFIAAALEFFGDPDPQRGSPHDRGARLAELVAREPAILILDGVEPLQYGSGPLQGRIEDPALLALVESLAQRPGAGRLCVITSRRRLTDLAAFEKHTVIAHGLEHLHPRAGAALLHHAGATRRGAATIHPDDGELKHASREVRGHALTLHLLGSYLGRAHGGDISRRDRVPFQDANSDQGGHAFRVIAAYENWLQEDPSLPGNGYLLPEKGLFLAILGQLLLRTGILFLKTSLLFNKASLVVLEDGERIGKERWFLPMAKRIRDIAIALRTAGSWIGGLDARLHGIERPRQGAPRRPGPAGSGEPRPITPEQRRDMTNRQRMLAILRLLGLFDRPAHKDLLATLCREPPIRGLTDPLVGLAEEDWNGAVHSLQDLDLVSQQGGALDAHPLVRAYFAERLQRQTNDIANLLRLADAQVKADPAPPKAAKKVDREYPPSPWVSGHRRLYEHLTTTTPERPDTLVGLAPLYQAIVHGCHAGLHREALHDVYMDRILRGTGPDGFYSRTELGAMGADLGAGACFFEHPWRQPAARLAARDRAWLLGEAAFYLRALGRLQEAMEPLQAALRMTVEQEDWVNAATGAGNIGQLAVILGDLEQAVADGERSVQFAERSEDWLLIRDGKVTHADALHQAGKTEEARRLFMDAERLQAEQQPQYSWLYSVRGFLYCELLLAEAERAAWQCVGEWTGAASPVGAETGTPPLEDTQQGRLSPRSPTGQQRDALTVDCHQVTERAAQAMEFALPRNRTLDIALNRLTLGRAALYRVLLAAVAPVAGHGGAGGAPAEGTAFQAALSPREYADIESHLDTAVDGLRAAGRMEFLPGGLVTRAAFRAVSGDNTGARVDLAEALDIAERGPMPLLKVDILLARVRLFPSDPERAALEAEARRLVKRHGYDRRAKE
uniref:SEFIR domain-containing protein n=1 Tax=Candidatus Kentrum sp. LFY TaxID=2126342 RepID=A0A450WRK3_9GAMM|nr:MAG: SEFIR domain-containing protein [Candidatus Kentron sp. LFY]